ncbi:hypothetical protein AKJ16_DCAP14357 [Drosera capensis]
MERALPYTKLHIEKKVGHSKALVVPTGEGEIAKDHSPTRKSNVLQKPRKRYAFQDPSIIYDHRPHQASPISMFQPNPNQTLLSSFPSYAPPHPTVAPLSPQTPFNMPTLRVLNRSITTSSSSSLFIDSSFFGDKVRSPEDAVIFRSWLFEERGLLLILLKLDVRGGIRLPSTF